MFRSILTLVLTLSMATTGLADRFVFIDGDRAYLIDGQTVERLPIVRLNSGGGTNPTDPPEAGSLTEWVAKRVKGVTDHKNREAAQSGLASTYLGLAKLWRDGKIKSQTVLMAERKKVHDKLTDVLGAADEWKEFDADLVAELNRRKATDIPKSLEEIAAGLSQGKAINPAVIRAGIKLVMALLSKDKDAVSTAITELVVALLGQIGG